MEPIELTYGMEGFEEINRFLMDNKKSGYTLSIYNTLEQATIEVICDFDSMLDVLLYVSNTEHDFPQWIGINPLSESYVVGVAFTRGSLKTPSVCEWTEGRLVQR